MEIKGFQPTSLIDYPDKICSVIFVSGCNFRCGYCHNKDLVLSDSSLESISEEQILSHLEKRKHLVDGVVITGGEPTLYTKELPQLIQKIKKLNYLVKLDTNGTNPQLIQQLIDQNLVNYIAMDIKAPLEKTKYDKVTNIDTNIENIKQSIELIKNINKTKDINIDHEFRTTVVSSLLTKEDVVEIAKSLVGCQKFVIQQFVKQTELLDAEFNNERVYSYEELEEIRKKCGEFVECEVR